MSSAYTIHKPVTFHPDPLSFVRVIREKPILSKYTYYAVVNLHDSIQLALHAELSFFCNMQSYN